MEHVELKQEPPENDPGVERLRELRMTAEAPGQIITRTRRPKSSLAMTMLAAAALGGFNPFGRGGGRATTYRRGPCRVCGKQDVAAGRQRGVYLCGEHLHLEHEKP